MAALSSSSLAGNGRTLILLLTLCLSLCAAQELSIRLVDLYPFGPGNGDDMLASGDNVEMTVDLETPIPYFGQLRHQITVKSQFQLNSMNGIGLQILSVVVTTDKLYLWCHNVCVG